MSSESILNPIRQLHIFTSTLNSQTYIHRIVQQSLLASDGVEMKLTVTCLIEQFNIHLDFGLKLFKLKLVSKTFASSNDMPCPALNELNREELVEHFQLLSSFQNKNFLQMAFIGSCTTCFVFICVCVCSVLTKLANKIKLIPR